MGDRSGPQARRHRCGASRDRFIRSANFDGRNETDPPTVAEYEQLCRLAGGVPLATLQHPDGPARADQIRRGQAAKGNRGGRPRRQPCKQRRQAWIGLAREMRDKDERISYREIARRLNDRGDNFPNVTHGTIANWLKMAE